MGEKQVLEAQIEQLRGQLKDASATTTNLQSQPKISGALQVDVDPDRVTDADLMVENETLHADLSDALKEIEALKARLAQTESHAESQSQPISEPVSEPISEPISEPVVEPVA